jgi:hypothetical protein
VQSVIGCYIECSTTASRNPAREFTEKIEGSRHMNEPDSSQQHTTADQPDSGKGPHLVAASGKGPHVAFTPDSGKGPHVSDMSLTEEPDSGKGPHTAL